MIGEGRPFRISDRRFGKIENETIRFDELCCLYAGFLVQKNLVM